jgi:hypothetical protein
MMLAEPLEHLLRRYVRSGIGEGFVYALPHPVIERSFPWLRVLIKANSDGHVRPLSWKASAIVQQSLFMARDSDQNAQ